MKQGVRSVVSRCAAWYVRKCRECGRPMGPRKCWRERRRDQRAGILIIADRGHLERLANRLRRGLTLSRCCVAPLIVSAITAIARRAYHLLKVGLGLGIRVAATQSTAQPVNSSPGALAGDDMSMTVPCLMLDLV